MFLVHFANLSLHRFNEIEEAFFVVLDQSTLDALCGILVNLHGGIQRIDLNGILCVFGIE